MSRKLAKRIEHRQSNELRLIYRAEALFLTADRLVFIDESLFNKTTGCQHYIYSSVGQPGWYHASCRRTHSWNILPAYTINGYLPCTGTKEGWFNTEEFYRWVADKLLAHCCSGQIIRMDNAIIYCNEQVEELIWANSPEICYLPLYSLDLNPIRLTFSILNA